VAGGLVSGTVAGGLVVAVEGRVVLEGAVEPTGAAVALGAVVASGAVVAGGATVGAVVGAALLDPPEPQAVATCPRATTAADRVIRDW
jgi:hypothetical protein